jgi:hypothetical protein
MALTGKQQAFVAYYCGEARWNATQAARLAGYSGDDASLNVTGSRLLSTIKVREAIDVFRQSIREESIANIERRVDTYLSDFDRIDRLIQARSEDPSTLEGPGGDTGLIVHSYKIVGTGRDSRAVDEWAFDAALMNARQVLRRQLAQELGQWTERHEGKETSVIQIVGVDADKI